MYQQALVDFPRNGWALHGLASAYDLAPASSAGSAIKGGGGDWTDVPAGAVAARRMEAEVWGRADVTLLDSATIVLPSRLSPSSSGLLSWGRTWTFVLLVIGLAALVWLCCRGGSGRYVKDKWSEPEYCEDGRVVGLVTRWLGLGLTERELVRYGETDRLLFT